MTVTGHRIWYHPADPYRFTLRVRSGLRWALKVCQELRELGYLEAAPEPGQVARSKKDVRPRTFRKRLTRRVP